MYIYIYIYTPIVIIIIITVVSYTFRITITVAVARDSVGLPRARSAGAGRSSPAAAPPGAAPRSSYKGFPVARDFPLQGMPLAALGDFGGVPGPLLGLPENPLTDYCGCLVLGLVKQPNLFLIFLR